MIEDYRKFTCDRCKKVMYESIQASIPANWAVIPLKGAMYDICNSCLIDYNRLVKSFIDDNEIEEDE